jgi:hypothetical protein
VTAQIVHLDSDEHRAVAALLPWHVNRTLSGAEQARVDAHLPICARCQAEVGWQRRLIEATAATAAEGDVERGWSRLASRLHGRDETARPAASARASPPIGPPLSKRRQPTWLAWAIAAQLVCAIGVTAWIVAVGREPALYRALGAPDAAAQANVLIVFRASATEAKIRAALRAENATLVGGPTVTDAYLVRVPPSQVAVALAHLRADASVRHAESLDAAR